MRGLRIPSPPPAPDDGGDRSGDDDEDSEDDVPQPHAFKPCAEATGSHDDASSAAQVESDASKQTGSSARRRQRFDGTKRKRQKEEKPEPQEQVISLRIAKKPSAARSAMELLKSVQPTSIMFPSTTQLLNLEPPGVLHVVGDYLYDGLRRLVPALSSVASMRISEVGYMRTKTEPVQLFIGDTPDELGGNIFINHLQGKYKNAQLYVLYEIKRSTSNRRADGPSNHGVADDEEDPFGEGDERDSFGTFADDPGEEGEEPNEERKYKNAQSRFYSDAYNAAVKDLERFSIRTKRDPESNMFRLMTTQIDRKWHKYLIECVARSRDPEQKAKWLWNDKDTGDPYPNPPIWNHQRLRVPPLGEDGTERWPRGFGRPSKRHFESLWPHYDHVARAIKPAYASAEAYSHDPFAADNAGDDDDSDEEASGARSRGKEKQGSGSGSTFNASATDGHTSTPSHTSTPGSQNMPPSNSAPLQSPNTRLLKLAALRDQGLVNADEFEAKRRVLVDLL